MAKPGNIQSSSRARRHGAVSTQSNGKERRLGQLEFGRNLKGEVELKKLQEDKEYKEERGEHKERISDEGATVDQTCQ